MMILNSVKIYKIRLFIVNLIIFVSLCFLIFKNFDEIRYVKISNDKGETFILDRFTSKIRLNN